MTGLIGGTHRRVVQVQSPSAQCRLRVEVKGLKVRGSQAAIEPPKRTSSQGAATSKQREPTDVESCRQNLATSVFECGLAAHIVHVCVCVDLCSDEATRAQPGAAREQTGAAKRLQTQFRCAKEGKRQKLSRFTLCVCREKGADVLTKEFGETWPSSLAGPSHA